MKVSEAIEAGYDRACEAECVFAGALPVTVARHVLTAISEAGYVVVPREPTAEMYEAGDTAYWKGTSRGVVEGRDDPPTLDIYRAMLSAAEKE